MTFFSLSIGQKGESMAKSYLKSKGYKILKTNFRTRFGEIDIVCLDQYSLVFVEVKTKTSNRFGAPEEMFTPHKYHQVYNTAQYYLTLHPDFSEDYRIDLIAITLDRCSKLISLSHYPSVY